jgi:hypothetical protein
MELQTLTNDIASARARLAAARATRDMGKARGLEEEIARAEAQRDRLLAHITTNLVSAPEPAPKGRGKDAQPAAEPPNEPAASEAPAADPAPVAAVSVESETLPAAEARPDEAAPSAEVEDAETEAEPAPPEAATPEPPLEAAPETGAEQPSPETGQRAVATGAAPPAPAPQAASAEGGKNMWDQLKPSDIARAKEDLVTRRAEMLARHAEELLGLEADQAQLDGLEQAITAFLEKFNAAPGAGVVKLDQERELRQTAG